VYTVALTLVPPDATPTVHDIRAALAAPERPLFIARKPCIPAAPIALDIAEAPTLREALEHAERISPERADPEPFPAWWPDGDGDDGEGVPLPVVDERDWA